LGTGALADITAMSTVLHELETEWSKSIFFVKTDFTCPYITAFRLADHSDFHNPLYLKMIIAISNYPALLEYFREGLLRFRQNQVSEKDTRTAVSDMIRQTAKVRDSLTEYLNSLNKRQVFGRFRGRVRRIFQRTQEQRLNQSLNTSHKKPPKTPPKTDVSA
jgi:predicted Zn-dependent peptidase